MAAKSERLTHETVTDEQIRELRDGAAAAGDLEQVSICDRALMGEDDDPDGNAYASWPVDEARQACAIIINYSRIQAEQD